MGKNLLRNAGFERGDAEFWEAELNCSIEADSTEHKYGSYSLKITNSSGGTTKVRCKDYIEVTEGELLQVAGWFKEPVGIAATMLMYLETIDADYNQIGNIGLGTLATSTSWQEFLAYTAIEDSISYIRLNPWVSAFANAEVLNADSFIISKLKVSELLAHYKTLISVLNETTSHTVNGSEFFTLMWKEAEFELDCTSLTGTTPTLDVKIQAYDPSTSNWLDIATFTQLTTSGSQHINIDKGLGWKQRVQYTTGGTVTDCDFELGVVYKR